MDELERSREREVSKAQQESRDVAGSRQRDSPRVRCAIRKRHGRKSSSVGQSKMVARGRVSAICRNDTLCYSSISWSYLEISKQDDNGCPSSVLRAAAKRIKLWNHRVAVGVRVCCYCIWRFETASVLAFEKDDHENGRRHIQQRSDTSFIFILGALPDMSFWYPETIAS